VFIEVLLFPLGPIDSFVDHIVNIPAEILEFLNQLSKLTPSDHNDYADVKSAITAVETYVATCITGTSIQMRHEEVLRVQKSIISTGVIVDPSLDDLSNPSRILLHEGELQRICRRKNKTCHFWLFDNNLMVGTPLAANSFLFGRSMPLSSIAVSKGAKEEEFNILSPSKSFTVIAANKAVCNAWVESLQRAIADYNSKNSGGNNDNPAQQITYAPLWVSDKSQSQCTICNLSFTLWRRKHHCRMCGEIVCNDHSLNKMVIQSIHKTDKQRVCDKCWSGSSTSLKTEPLINSNAANASSSIISSSFAYLFIYLFIF
jgi:hypothetical protein